MVLAAAIRPVQKSIVARGGMPEVGLWILVALFASATALLALALLRISVGRGLQHVKRDQKPMEEPALEGTGSGMYAGRLGQMLEHRRRILVVDDDHRLRLVLRTTLAADEYVVEEASSAEEASELARFWRPTVVVLDVGLPGMSGIAFCRELKRKSSFGAPTVILLTGADTSLEEARASGADSLLRKPFSPLELVSLIERLPEGEPVMEAESANLDTEQLLVYARDLSRVIQVERAQRRLLQQSYRQTVTALADALEAKDPHTGLHALRVRRYALELTSAVDESLLDDSSLEYGFLLHDIGKIAVPDSILSKPGPLSAAELQRMQQHPLVGAELLHDIALLDGEGIRVVRSHHERWDGRGYPDRLAEQEIPLGARIFALADSLDAMTSDRPYRARLPWDEAVDEILAQDGSQFDPRVVTAFAVREPRLRRIQEELAPHAA
jgi:response regulator RpfG family c-di-GMP phosphodiesterase